MKLNTALVALSLFGTASAFAPQPMAAGTQRASLTELEMANGAKRKAALKAAKKVAGAVGSVALATAGLPPAARAAETAVESAKDAKNVVTVGAGAFAAGIVANKLLENLDIGSIPETADKIEEVFPGAKSNKKLVKEVASALKELGYGKDSLVATSLCADEVNRVLEEDLSKAFGDNFSMGGLAGFPFGGITSFGAMASHIPDGGSCLVVFGPHVGVDSTGKVGTVERRGRANGGACCGSAVAASGYVSGVHTGQASKYGPPETAIDAQQNFVGTMLLPYAAHLEKAADKMVDLPYALYDAQKKMVDEIVTTGAGSVADGKVSVLGGIQVNTPDGESDYFLPLSFEVYNNSGELVEDMSDAIDCGVLPAGVAQKVEKKEPVEA
eukprot:CAMPEP_0181036654 /NCGR_PEP_ID=MMETSP1070-20121207/8982_1 /TAXON_ID=265543 /ORGANISM="Minutocellus polymorphus, Strain NH13" /LENGTH=383 /DNA_ID=CAMNT_0023114315 /DNA_START=13 /DNA_END=1164 /DNA_ORIENTATION=+